MNEITFSEMKQFLQDILQCIRQELYKCQRPADQIILKEADVMNLLGISKRKIQLLKARREIPYSQPRARTFCYYLLSDILNWLKNSRIESINLLSKSSIGFSNQLL